VIDAQEFSASAAAAVIMQYMAQNAIQVVNVAGPRASGWIDGHSYAVAVDMIARTRGSD